MSAATIRGSLVAELKAIPGLGGVEDRIVEFAYESDDVAESKAYWETTQEAPLPGAGIKVINAAMVTRTARREEERASGGTREFHRIHTFKVLFRYGRPNDPQAEKTFESLLEAILDKIEGNDAIFRTPGIGSLTGSFHPQPYATQTAKATIGNKKLFGSRIWEAIVELEIVEHKI